MFVTPEPINILIYIYVTAVQLCHEFVNLCNSALCVTQLATDMQRERALTVKGNASESQSEMNDQHAPKRTAKHSQVPDAAELIRRHEAEQEHSPDMCLSVHTLTQRTIRVNVHNSWDIGAVKSLIGIVMTGVPPDAMRLVNAGRQLQDKYLLSDYDIGDEANLHLVLKLGGD